MLGGDCLPGAAAVLRGSHAPRIEGLHPIAERRFDLQDALLITDDVFCTIHLTVQGEMAHGRNKYQSRENRAKIRQILMQEWDPIGVREVPQAQGEYDSCLGRVYVMLMDERATREAVAAYLFDIAARHMALAGQPGLVERCDQTAATLVSLRAQFGLH